MLVTFRFENFRSFAEEAELSLRAHRADKTLVSSLLKPSGNASLLPAVAIYGANAAGKTNVLAALAYMRRAVRDSQTRFDATGGTSVEPHLNAQHSPSEFEVEVFLGRRRYVYGFKADQAAFLEEWLYSFPKGRRALIFSRVTNDGETTVSFGSTLKGDTKFVESTVKRTRENSLFVSAAAQDNHPIANQIYSYFRDMFFSSLRERIDIPRNDLTSTLVSEFPHLHNIVLRLLQSADSSIQDIIVEAKEGDSWSNFKTSEKSSFFQIDRHRYRVSFVYGIGDDSFVIPLLQQSRGIRKLYAVAGEIAGCLVKREIMLFDEIEGSIHPHMARLIIDMFQDTNVNHAGSQMIFTTHDTGLLDQTLLRRDQIWFVEKERLCSRLYSLLDFSPRKDANLEAGYLRGRYGAIPVARPRSDWVVRPSSRGGSDEEYAWAVEGD